MAPVVVVAWIAFASLPVVLTQRRGERLWPWIALGLLLGPLALGMYALKRMGERKAAERLHDAETKPGP